MALILICKSLTSKRESENLLGKPNKLLLVGITASCQDRLESAAR